jgi:excisionase family DNA binding protein
MVKMNIQSKAPVDTRLAYRVKDFCERVGISSATFYKYVNLGRINPIKIGGRTLVPASEVERLLRDGTASSEKAA